MRGTPKGFEPLRQNEHSLPPSRGKVAPSGPDEGGYRWVRRPSNGRMGTSAPTQGYDRFRRGRCPQRPVDNGCTPVVPLIRHGLTPMPPSPLRGEGFGRSVGNAQMSMAFPSSVTANAVPPSPRGRLSPKNTTPPGVPNQERRAGFYDLWKTDCRVGVLPLLPMTEVTSYTAQTGR